jgi:hypothetical protein
MILSNVKCNVNVVRKNAVLQDSLNDLIDAFERRDVHHGETVITQGEDGDNFYAIQSYVVPYSSSMMFGRLHAYNFIHIISIILEKFLKCLIKQFGNIVRKACVLFQIIRC